MAAHTSEFALVPRVVWQGHQPREVKVYCALASYVDWETGVCWPSRSTIAGAIGVSVSTVDRALKLLVVSGVIEIDKRITKVGDHDSNLYRLPFAINSTFGGGRSSAATVAAELTGERLPLNHKKTLPTVVSSSEPVLFDYGTAVKAIVECPRDFYYEAACAALDLPHDNSDNRALGTIASKARKGGYQPGEILRRAALHLATFDFPLTPGSMVKRWDQLGSRVTTATRSQRQRFADEMDRMRRRQEIVEGTMLLGDES